MKSENFQSLLEMVLNQSSMFSYMSSLSLQDILRLDSQSYSFYYHFLILTDSFALYYLMDIYAN